jgi:hypothetical protein
VRAARPPAAAGDRRDGRRRGPGDVRPALAGRGGR